MKTRRPAGALMLVIALMLGSKAVWAQAPSDAVVQQLREQGYTGFKVSRTLLGRVRVLAWTPDGGRRELVFNPGTGEILRDYVTAHHTRASASVAPVPRVLDRPEDDPAPASSGGVGATSGGDHAAAVSASGDGATSHEEPGTGSTGPTNSDGVEGSGGTSNEADDGTGAGNDNGNAGGPDQGNGSGSRD